MCIMWVSALDLSERAAMTAWLSSLHRTRWPLHDSPHTTDATIMGISSFTAIPKWRDWLSHPNWNHTRPDQAVQPNNPNASDVTTWALVGSCVVAIATPFHWGANAIHQSRSEQMPRLCRAGCCPECLVCGYFSKSIIRLRNERPGRTSLQAWLRIPINDYKSLWQQTFWSPHFAMRTLSLKSLSEGSQSSFATVSISIPRSIQHNARPTALLVA